MKLSQSNFTKSLFIALAFVATILVGFGVMANTAEAGTYRGEAVKSGMLATRITFSITAPDTVTAGQSFNISASACADDSANPTSATVGYNIVGVGSADIINTGSPNLQACESGSRSVTINTPGTYDIYLNGNFTAAWSFPSPNGNGTITVTEPRIDGQCAAARNTCVAGNTPYNIDNANDILSASGLEYDTAKWGCRGSGPGHTDTAGNACSFDIPSCDGVFPLNTEAWAGDGVSGGSDENKSYSAADTAPGCQYKCADGFERSGGSCVPATYSCTGGIPAGSIRWDAEEESSLVSNTAWTYAFPDSEAKCQYHCDFNYSRIGGNCIWDPPVVNDPPSAEAGIPRTITLPINSVNASGASASDSDGTYTILWYKVGGPAAGAVTNNRTLTPTFTGMNTAGVYTYEMFVEDDDGDWDTDRMTVTVLAGAVNAPPLAEAGDPQFISQPISASAPVGVAASDSDGPAPSILWTNTDRPAGSPVPAIASPTTLTPNFSNLTSVGVYTFEIEVTDDDLETTTDTMTVTVDNGVAAPGACPAIITAADVDTCAVGTPFNTSASDIPTEYGDFAGHNDVEKWGCQGVSGAADTAIDACVYDVPSCDGIVPPHAIWRLDDGDFDRVGIVVDDVKSYAADPGTPRNCEFECVAGYDWISGACQLSGPPNQPPTATAGNNLFVTLPDEVSDPVVGATANDPDGPVPSILWTQVGILPTVATVNDGTTLTPYFSDLTTVGVYTFEIEVTDGEGAADTAQMTVTVSPGPSGVDLEAMTPIPSQVDNGDGTYDLDIDLKIRNNGPDDLSPSNINHKVRLNLEDTTVQNSATQYFNGSLNNGVTTGPFVHSFTNIPFGNHEVCSRVNLDPLNDFTEDPLATDTVGDGNQTCLSLNLAVPEPSVLEISTDKQFVRSGEKVIVSWNITSILPLSCVAKGPGGVSVPINVPAGGNVSNSAPESGPIYSSGDFLLTCDPVPPILGLDPFTAKTSVEVIPVYEER